jgi:hypothetical protein
MKFEADGDFLTGSRPAGEKTTGRGVDSSSL